MVYRGSSSSLSLVEVTIVPIKSKPVVEKQKLRRKENSRSVSLSSISTTKEIEEVIWWAPMVTKGMILPFDPMPILVRASKETRGHRFSVNTYKFKFENH